MTIEEAVFGAGDKSLMKKTEKALKRGVKKALVEMQKRSRGLLRSAYPGTARRSKKSKYQDTITSSIRTSKVKMSEDGSTIYGTLRFGDTKKKGSGSFRGLFFEQGVKPRYTKKYKGKVLKKKRYTGRLKRAPVWFLQKVEQDSAAIDRIINQEFERQ